MRGVTIRHNRRVGRRGRDSQTAWRSIHAWRKGRKMMLAAITFESSGAMSRTRVQVYQDGAWVAEIKRYSARTGWTIDGHYWEELRGHIKTLDEARAIAREMEYPTKQEIYEKLCARTEVARRHYFERALSPRLYELTRAMLVGSNSARVEIEALLAEVESKAKDRSVEKTWRIGSEEPGYPKPPEKSTEPKSAKPAPTATGQVLLPTS